jgi:formyl-CoA transferase
MGSFGALAALYRRAQDPDFAGEFVDVALFEALFRLIDWHVPVYDQLGEIPIRNGNRPIVAPGAAAGMYRTREGAWITVSSATLRSVLNVVRAVGLPEAEYQTWDQQMANHDVLDGALRDWVAERSLAVCLQELHEAEAVAERVFTAEDICNDETYRERGDIVSVDHPQLGAIRMPAALPKMRNHPGSVWRPGVELGADNELVYGQWLGLSAQERSELASRGVI